MSNSATFTGTGFYVESFIQLTSNSVRVTYSNDPVAVSTTGSHDALNPLLYTISGPTANGINFITSTLNDSQSVDIFLNDPLTTGTWTFTITAVQSKDGITISNTTFSLSAVYQANSDLGTGILSESPYDILKNSFNPYLQGPGWEAILSALASGDQTNRTNAELAFDQLFISSASSNYLERLCADRGLVKPPNLGISDDSFRKLAIKTTTKKLTLETLLEILEIYYGSDAARAHAISGDSNGVSTYGEPYALNDGDTLNILLDEKTNILVTFNQQDFTDIAIASSQEIVNIINRTFQQNKTQAFAVAQLDPSVGKTFVYIYSGSLGLAGSVRITGGKAQNVLLFGSKLGVPFTTPTWTITKYSGGTGSSSPEKLRFTPSGGLDLSSIRLGDYINIYGSEFSSANIGTFTITNLSDLWFEVDNISGVAQTVSQAAQNDLLFFRPKKNTIQNQSIIATAVQDPSSINVLLPTVSKLINRNQLDASYLHPTTSVAVSQISRNSSGLCTVTTSSAHGFSSGQNVFIDNASGSGLNGTFNITVTSTTTFTYTTPEYLVTTTSTNSACTATPFKPTTSTVKGPYSYDTQSGVGITAISTTITQDLAQGSSYRQISVSNSSSFPDGQGYLVFKFGTSYQVAPVRYLSRPSSSSLLLDSTFVFPITVSSGSDVTLLVQKGVFVPENPETLGSSYVTGSASGRISAQQSINSVVASGVTVNQTVIYPGDRGLGAEGYPGSGASKLSDKVYCWGGDDPDTEIPEARSGD